MSNFPQHYNSIDLIEHIVVSTSRNPKYSVVDLMPEIALDPWNLLYISALIPAHKWSSLHVLVASGLVTFS